ncbi:pyridoxal phosphate biosynthetic protein [Erythrobacter crassostreae]|uniref:Pyridoxal phosphate biosynthetic protein n=1 Tax=Erythrobacter crassostreae TaxID=2828328 RepID=A0A9X1JNB1_9SPHN|nr:pyridoxal phosphate biosynthetic protein [Erythrobacter crassostrea]MBV7259538.1 pyridoxal phosphate biosynthetic protein [Erythrobacter crassostrea]
MDTSDAPDLTPEQKRWAFFGSTLFLTSVGFLGFAFAEGFMLTFAIGWVALQIFGYVGALKMANGEIAHPLFKSQVVMHGLVLGLLTALFIRATS